jgi:phosphorylase/glycogen(starch) synthase
MESIAFGIPTMTTTYAGFGTWVQENLKKKQHAVQVIDRKNKTDDECAGLIATGIKQYVEEGDPMATSQEAKEISNLLLWENLDENYQRAWEIAVNIANARKEIQAPQWIVPETHLVEPSGSGETPVWKRIIVEPDLPGPLKPLKEIAFNLWWSWDVEAKELFREIDAEKWKKVKWNPVLFLESLSLEEITALAEDKKFIDKLNRVYARFREYMDAAKEKEKDQIAYFSMEYGLHNSIKTYSGGLGILAGDYLKQASDSNKNMIAIGLMYRQGYFKQLISHLGDQIAEYNIQETNQLPIESVKDEKGDSVRVAIALPGRVVWAKAWKLNVGRIPLYLLDTNINDNNEQDRKLSSQLYGGDNEHRLKQEMLLGLGGIRLIKNLNLNPAIYHSNEGHAAFIGLERIDKLIDQEHISFYDAMEYVRATTLFTTHTPVPAGHDSFEEHLIRAYLSHFADHFSISWEEFIGLGRFRPKDASEKFSMSVLATKLSREVNGVSRIHGRVSRNMFKGLYPGFYEEELHIGYVTNGVHYYTWTNSVWQKLYQETFDEKFEHNQSDPRMWENIYDISDEKIWLTRQTVKRELIAYVKECIQHDLTDRQESPKLTLESLKYISDKCLIFGFARRFATYKRAHLLFMDTERLARIVNNPERPVIFIFAGKAHPRDKAGQDLIKFIIEVSKREEFVGRILFLEDYDMTMGKMLTSGVDVWVNTPTRPLEASGTSGEKATLNGVLNFSVPAGLSPKPAPTKIRSCRISWMPK